MLKKMDTVDMHKVLIKHIEDRTQCRCYDKVPQKAQSPFYYAELTGKRPDNTKTMWREIFTFAIHCIAKPDSGSVAVYKMIDDLETAMTEDLELPDGYWLVMQTNNGLQALKTDETNEKHAIVVYDFTVCYGFKTK